jgi:hypothetical protein
LALGNLKKICYILGNSGRGNGSEKGGLGKVTAVDIFPENYLPAPVFSVCGVYWLALKGSDYSTGGEISLTFSQDRTKKV